MPSRPSSLPSSRRRLLLPTPSHPNSTPSTPTPTLPPLAPPRPPLGRRPPPSHTHTAHRYPPSHSIADSLLRLSTKIGRRS